MQMILEIMIERLEKSLRKTDQKKQEQKLL